MRDISPIVVDYTVIQCVLYITTDKRWSRLHTDFPRGARRIAPLFDIDVDFVVTLLQGPDVRANLLRRHAELFADESRLEVRLGSSVFSKVLEDPTLLRCEVGCHCTAHGFSLAPDDHSGFGTSS